MKITKRTEITTRVPDRWKCYEPDEGFISICSEVSSKEICRLEVSDFDNEEHAIEVGKIIASLPELLQRLHEAEVNIKY